jgi:hypothetical protein
MDSARLSQFYAASLPVLRDHQAEKKTTQADIVAEVVRNGARALELGHDANRSSRGAKAMLLDVLT